jgi:CBS domain-containing protein
MKDSLKVGTIFGISIELHVSFILLMLLLGYVAIVNGRVGWFVYVLTLFFFVLLHELSHSIMAKKYGVEVTKISLLPFGGIANMERMPKDPKQELAIAFAGPFMNFLIAGAMFLILAAVPGGTARIFPFFELRVTWNILDIVVIVLKANLILGIFNLMIPALPMDGGRIFRAILAEKIGFSRATDVASGVARIIAVAMGILGILAFNVWFLIIAFFIYMGALQEANYSRLSDQLSGVRAGDVMSTNLLTVTGDMSLKELSDIIMKFKHMGYPVLDGDELIGIITFTDLANVKSNDWESIKVGDIMSKDILTVLPEEDMMDVLTKMLTWNVGRVPVVKDGMVIGIVSKTDIIRTTQIKGIMK